MQRIDQTLAKSRQIVQESIELTKRSSSRKANRGSIENMPEPTYYNMPLIPARTPDQLADPVSFYEERILDLTEQLHNEEFIKTNYENALKDLRDRLTEIELKDSERSTQHSLLLNEQKENFARREKELLDKISEMEKVNRQLQLEVQNSDHTLKAKITQLEREKASLENQYNNLYTLQNHGLKQKVVDFDSDIGHYKRLAEAVPRLEEELNILKKKYVDEMSYGKELQAKIKCTEFEGQMKENTKKILKIEEDLKKTACKGSRENRKKKTVGSAKRLKHRSKSSKPAEKTPSRTRKKKC